ncbi:MAG: 30S ribosomal protein S6 [Candidatus Marinimicrobia bacterium]|nr:30S ribosomal protein S6 [Candidatus Neomarinimicrobiota bacterium]
MNYYESLYIVHSALEAGRLKDIVLTVEKFLKDNGGELLATEIWGKKKLGYYIDKQKYGTYILIQFKSDGTKNNNFNVEMEHNPSILAYMTVKIDEDGIREQTEDLDTQIAGKEAKTSRTPRVEAAAETPETEETAPTAEETTTEEAVVEAVPTEEVVAEKAEETKEEETVVEEAPVETEVASEEKVEE